MRPAPRVPPRVTKATIDHDRIQRWAEERGAKPTIVRGTGILRLDFPGFAGPDKLQRVSWDAWFERFEESNLALLYEETTAGGVKGVRSPGQARRVRRAPGRAAGAARAKKAKKAARPARRRGSRAA